jgi:SAM-dependent methyltransferase
MMGQPTGDAAPRCGLMSRLRCPSCAASLSATPGSISCSGCELAWPVRNGIPRFYESDGYWGEIPRAEAASLIRDAADKGWRQAVAERFAGRRDMLLSLLDWQRASWLPLLALPDDAVALDIGSGYGAITQSLAHASASVYSVEAIPERIEFTSIRLAQEAIDNVQLIQGSALALPLMDEGFDLIVVNGVLEWIGAWQTDGDPRTAQLEFLRSLHRILKPDGVLVVGIENRFSYEAMCGGLDHSGVRYTSLMPRRLASMYMRQRPGAHYRTSSDRPREYRTYTYSARGYKSLLGAVGFVSEFYWPYPGYNEPSSVIPLERRLVYEQLLANFAEPFRRTRGGWRAWLKRVAAATGLLRLLVPDFLILASKGGRQACSRLWTETNKALRSQHLVEPSRAWLCGGNFGTKSVLRVYGSASTTAQLILKTSAPAPGSGEAVLDEYGKLSFVALRAQEWRPRFSVPRPLASFQAANYLYTAESTANGQSLARLLLLRSRRGRLALASRELPRCADAAIDVARMLHNATEIEEVAESWRRPSFGGRSPDYSPWVQHGDFTIENVFLQPRDGTVAIIDWQHVVRGMPPLYDAFSLLFTILPAIPADTAPADPIQGRFMSAFFDDGPWGRLFRDVIARVAAALQVPTSGVWGMFLESLVIRRHFHESRDAENPIASHLVPGVDGHRTMSPCDAFATYLDLAMQHCDRFVVSP